MKNKQLPAFTLIEVAIVLAIFGVLAGAVFKGMDLLEVARARSVVQDFEKYRLAILSYREHFQALPGDDAKANERFGVTSGNGNGIIDENEVPLFWQHLHKAGSVTSDAAPTSRWGGEFQPVYAPSQNMSGHWIRLAGPQGESLLTPQQAQKLYNHSDIKLTEGNDAQANQCIQNGIINLSNKKAVCIAYLPF